MNSVIGFTEILEKIVTDESLLRFIRPIKTGGNILLTTINNILDYSKLEAGKISLENIPFNLSILLEEIYDMISLKLIEKFILFAKDTPDLNYDIIGDPNRLRQVLLNLLSNAIKFTPTHGTITFNIITLYEDEDIIDFRFSIEDTGIGIPQDKLCRLFQVFSQVDNTISRKYGGTGLGLVISLNLVKLMGGNAINVESEEGKGSKFFFDLKLNKAKFDLNNVDLTDIKTIPENESLSILIVEDNEYNSSLLGEFFKLSNYNYDIACNGYKAIEKIATNYYDVILMDINMPEMNGIECSSSLRKSGINTPIIALTASVIESDKESCFIAGMDDFITKPFNSKKLIKAMKQNINFKRNINILNTDKPMNMNLIKKFLNLGEHFTKEFSVLEGGKEILDLKNLSYQINASNLFYLFRVLENLYNKEVNDNYLIDIEKTINLIKVEFSVFKRLVIPFLNKV